MDSSNKSERYLKDLKEVIDGLDAGSIDELVEMILKAYENGNQIFIFGNGGSASTASHLACDLNKGCCLGLDKRFKVICLNDNLPTLMAYSNDIGYEVVFVEQLKNFLKEKDLVIGISGSGNSENVVRALKYARDNKAVTAALVGYDGGKMKGIVDHAVHAQVDDMQKSEDIHLITTHIVMQSICDRLGVKYC